VKEKVAASAWAFFAIAAVFLVLAFFAWRQADTNPQRARADLRDSALVEGTEAIETMNSMDHRHVADGFRAWRAVSTGVLHDQLATVGSDEEQLVADQGKITSGHVVQAAVTELTDSTATVIAAVEITVRTDDDSAKPTVKRNRFSADLVLIRGQWKVENLQQVAVTTS
jgi:Mce-associated membrane protein